MKQPITFNQWVAAIMSGFFAVGLLIVLIISILNKLDFSQGIILAFSSSLTGCLGYLIGSSSGSHAKDANEADTSTKLIDALKNSAPSIQPPNIPILVQDLPQIPQPVNVE